MNLVRGAESVALALASPAPDLAAAALLEEAAAGFRLAGRRFEAAYITEQAARRVGSPRRILDLVQTALADYEVCWWRSDICTPGALAALVRSADLYRHWIWPRDDPRFRIRAKAVQEDLAGRLLRCSIDSPQGAGYLVRGVVIDASLTEDWTLWFPSGERDRPTASSDHLLVRIDVPAAFECYLRLADYVGAQRVVDLCPDAFNTPFLLGWKAVVRAHVWPDTAVAAFGEAADHFRSYGGPWAEYFRAHSLLASARSDPFRVVDLLLEASATLPRAADGSQPSEISRLATLLWVLSTVATSGTTADARAARDEFVDQARGGLEVDDDPTHHALVRLVADALEPLAADPVREMSTGRLLSAMEALRRLPHIPETASPPPTEPAINLRAGDVKRSPINTELHEAIAGVAGRGELDRLLLRIVHAWAQMHADIVHGPVQHGRDVVVLLRVDDEHILSRYRAVAGSAGTVDWPEVRSELEQLLHALLDGMPASPATVRKVGTLVVNAHVADHLRSEVAAWAGRIRRAHGVAVEMMDLDDCVNWILGARLVNDLRASLGELELSRRTLTRGTVR